MAADAPDPATGAPDGGAPVTHAYVSEGLTLSYVDWGNAAAPTLVLLHGASDHARSWDDTARALRHRYHVVAPDLRGHGDSAWSPDGAYLLPYHVLDFVAFADSIGGGPLTIVAHSFGGSVASRFAALYPKRVARLVLVDGFGPTPENFARYAAEGPVARTRSWIENRRAAATRPVRRLPTVAAAAERMIRNNARLTPPQAHHLAEHGTRQVEGGLVWKFDPRVGMFAPEDFAIPPAAFWPEVSAPTLLIHGALSWTGDPVANGFAANFPDHRSIAIPDAGHWPHHDRLDVFIAAMEGFL